MGKCAACVELGAGTAIDYRREDVERRIGELCPEGIDVFFDNVGGSILDAALFRIRERGRVVICGAISQYNEVQPKGPANYLALLVYRARMEGFVVFDYAPRYREACTARCSSRS